MTALPLSDKLNQHITNLCHFNDEDALSPDSSGFKCLSQEAQKHTKYCFDNSIKKSTALSWKTSLKVKRKCDEMDTSVFKNFKKKTEDEDNEEEGKTDGMITKDVVTEEGKPDMITRDYLIEDDVITNDDEGRKNEPVINDESKSIKEDKHEFDKLQQDNVLLSTSFSYNMQQQLMETVRNEVRKAIYESFVTEISNKISENIKKDVRDNDVEEQIEIDQIFEEFDDDRVVCKVCLKHINDLSKGLKKHFKGEYGTFKKHDTACSKTNKERRKRLHEHVHSFMMCF